MEDDLLTVDQVADKLCITKQTVWKYIRDERIPATNFGKYYRIKRSDLEQFILNPIKE
jgi:excisionase family DNA binding protein